MTDLSLRVLALALAGSLLAACGVPGQDRATTLGAPVVPSDLVDTTAVETTVAVTTTTTVVEPVVPTTFPGEACYLKDGRLVRLPRTYALPADPADTIRALLDGPTATETRQLGVRSALRRESKIRAGTVSGGTVSVELGTAFGDLPAPEQLLAVAQVVCTLTSLPGVGQVAFTLDGRSVDVPRADGSKVSRPVSRSDYGLLFS
ncbi:MAG: GerMN domain-containing protein [Acidimicrobiia bacterium]